MRKPVFFVIVAISLVNAALLTGCVRSEAKAGAVTQPSPVSASVMVLAPQPFQARLPITGTLVSKARIDVKAEVIGRITRFDKEEGALVSAGEPTAWVNDENYQLSLRQAESAVKVAEAGVKRAQLLESHSRAELDRAANLLTSGGITDKDLKAAQLADRDARAQSALAEAQLDQARTALDVAGKHLRDTVIRAPISGEIERKLVNKGAYVEASTPVFTIVDNRRLELECAIPAAELAVVRTGQHVTFRVNSYPGVRFEGHVLDVGPVVDEQTRAAKVRIQVVNADSKLKAGMFVQGEVLTDANDRALVIPGSAVYRNDRSAKSSYVFVIEDGKAVRRDVQIGRERDSALEITGGLKPGDRVIVEQNIEIAEGVSIEARR